jgi:hypothetical protein
MNASFFFLVGHVFFSGTLFRIAKRGHSFCLFDIPHSFLFHRFVALFSVCLFLAFPGLAFFVLYFFHLSVFVVVQYSKSVFLCILFCTLNTVQCCTIHTFPFRNLSFYLSSTLCIIKMSAPAPNAAPRRTGRVKFFNSQKGFGFIIPSESTEAAPLDESKRQDATHMLSPSPRIIHPLTHKRQLTALIESSDGWNGRMESGR